MALFANILRSMLPLVPRPIVERVAARYVAGSTLEDALRAVRTLNAEGACATVDILGESIEEDSLVKRAVDDYLELIDAIHAGGVDSTVSVKPTMIGLGVSEELFASSMQILAKRAGAAHVVLTIDMEDHTTTDATLRVFEDLRAEGYPIGCVLQAYLHRTQDDIAALPEKSNVRICKGIYTEPVEIAYKRYEEVRAAYLRALNQLLSGGHYAGIATHDEYLIDGAAALVNSFGLAKTGYEFQMLLGVKPALRKKLLAEGHRVRIYVPYGRDWYPYSLRRLRENPQVAVHVLKAMLTGR